MSGLGGLNKSAQGVVMGLVQLQLPTVVTKADLAVEAAHDFGVGVHRQAAQRVLSDGTVLVMHDMAAGRYRLPWPVDVTDGTGCGFAPPTRRYAGPKTHPLAGTPAASFKQD